MAGERSVVRVGNMNVENRVGNVSVEERVAKAAELHGLGANCAQVVACMCADLVGADEMTTFKLTEGLGGGMGSHTETCGALSGGCAIIGYAISEGPHNPTTKQRTYEIVKQLVTRFTEEYTSTTCSDLKGLTGNLPKRPCDEYITGALRMTLGILQENDLV